MNTTDGNVEGAVSTGNVRPTNVPLQNMFQQHMRFNNGCDLVLLKSVLVANVDITEQGTSHLKFAEALKTI